MTSIPYNFRNFHGIWHREVRFNIFLKAIFLAQVALIGPFACQPRASRFKPQSGWRTCWNGEKTSSFCRFVHGNNGSVYTFCKHNVCSCWNVCCRFVHVVLHRTFPEFTGIVSSVFVTKSAFRGLWMDMTSAAQSRLGILSVESEKNVLKL